MLSFQHLSAQTEIFTAHKHDPICFTYIVYILFVLILTLFHILSIRFALHFLCFNPFALSLSLSLAHTHTRTNIHWPFPFYFPLDAFNICIVMMYAYERLKNRWIERERKYVRAMKISADTQVKEIVLKFMHIFLIFMDIQCAALFGCIAVRFCFCRTLLLLLLLLFKIKHWKFGVCINMCLYVCLSVYPSRNECMRCIARTVLI